MASKLAILNAMASPDFDRALDLHRQWGLVWIDLKDSIYGHTVETLEEGTALRAKDAIDAAGLKVYCLSTSLMHDDLAKGEAHFRSQHIDRIAGLATTVSILRPKYIRLLAGRLSQRPERALDRSAYVEMGDTGLSGGDRSRRRSRDLGHHRKRGARLHAGHRRGHGGVFRRA